MNPASLKPSAENELYPIRTVATVTGVNPITLRAWERRYGLIQPQRTGKGHRLYSREDIDEIRRVVALLDKGLSIGQVRHALARSPGVDDELRDQGPWTRYQAAMIAAVIDFDENGLEAIYNEALSLYPVDIVTRRLLLPLLQQLGERWRAAEGSIAEEHFFGVYLRNKLGARFHHRHRHNTGPTLLAACLPGEQHELGLLLFALSAHEHGYRLILLGADLPLQELPAAVRRTGADTVVLSGSNKPSPTLLDTELPALIREVRIPVIIGGAVSVRHHDAIVRAGATPVGSDIEHGLTTIGRTLGHQEENAR